MQYGLMSAADKANLDRLVQEHISRKEVEYQYVLQDALLDYLPDPVNSAVKDKDGRDIVDTYVEKQYAAQYYVYQITEDDDYVYLRNENNDILGQIPKYSSTQRQDKVTITNKIPGICVARTSTDLESEDQAFFNTAKTEAASGIKIGTQTFTVIGTPYYILNPGEQSATINMGMI